MTIRGKAVEALLVEQAAEIEREMYLAIASSRSLRGPLLIFAREGGVDIESWRGAIRAPSCSTPIDPLLGLLRLPGPRRGSRRRTGPGGSRSGGREKALGAVVRKLWKLYRHRDATLVEVNPLVLTKQGEVVCLDSKVTVDDNALYRQPDLTPVEPDDEREAKARASGLAFVPLDGDIGVVGNGAGLVMSTIDQIAAAGGSAADFCDIGGGARAEVVRAALEAIFAGPPIAAVLVSIFGGITRGDEVARGLIEALGTTGAGAPVVVRLDGNAAEEGRAVLAEAAPRRRHGRRHRGRGSRTRGRGARARGQRRGFIGPRPRR